MIFIRALSEKLIRIYSLVRNLNECRNKVPKDVSRTGRAAKFLCEACRRSRKGLKVQAPDWKHFLISSSAIRMIKIRTVFVPHAEGRD